MQLAMRPSLCMLWTLLLWIVVFVDYLFVALLFCYQLISTKKSVIATCTQLPQTGAVGREQERQWQVRADA